MLSKLTISTFDFADFKAKLVKGSPALDQEAIDNVVEHFAAVHPDAESWINQGLGYVSNETPVGKCPFCAQSLQASPIIAHYRQYFNQAYQDFAGEISQLTTQINRSFSEQNLRNIANTNASNEDLCRFWGKFSDNIDFDADQVVQTLETVWDDTKRVLKRLSDQKSSRSLDAVQFDDDANDQFIAFATITKRLERANVAIDITNAEISRLKSTVADIDKSKARGDLNSKRATKRRNEPDIAPRSNAYLQVLADKSAAERSRDAAKSDLDNYRNTVFLQYETGINSYLDRFDTDFQLTGLHSRLTSSYPSGNYDVEINNQKVNIARPSKGPNDQSFRNTLSAGDRNALALAVFFESLDRRNNPTDSFVVIDDPVSRLDDYGAWATIEVIGSLRPSSCAQLIVLSHNKTFLLKLWDEVIKRRFKNDCAAVNIIRDGDDSTFEKWDINDARRTEHDRRHELFFAYLQNTPVDLKPTAMELRPHLESYLRVAHPGDFKPSEMIGNFLSRVKPRIGTNNEVLNQAQFDGVNQLTNFGNRFQHDTNANLDTENVTDRELRGYVKRTLRFVGQKV